MSTKKINQFLQKSGSDTSKIKSGWLPGTISLFSVEESMVQWNKLSGKPGKNDPFHITQRLVVAYHHTGAAADQYQLVASYDPWYFTHHKSGS